MNAAYTLMDLADEYAEARAVAVRGDAVDQARDKLLTALIAALADAERLRAGLLELRTVCEPEPVLPMSMFATFADYEAAKANAAQIALRERNEALDALQSAAYAQGRADEREAALTEPDEDAPPNHGDGYPGSAA